MEQQPDPALRDYHYAKITAYDAIEAGVLDAHEIADAKATLPELVFRELYLAEPADDGGNPFGLQHIAACTAPALSTKPAVAFGVDLAKKQDWFVIIGLDEDGAVSVFERWQQIPWRDSIRKVWSIVGEDVPALVDSTGLGDPVLEELQVEHSNFRGFNFSGPTKQRLMEGLAVSIQSHETHFPEGRIVNELEAFEFIYTRTGVRYAISDDAEDNHDDCVMALALAREQFTTVAPGSALLAHYANLGKQALRDAQEPKHEPALPWHQQQELPSRAELLDNELTALYNETLRVYDRPRNLCRGCGETVIGPSRVSDGEYVWHTHCARIAA